MRSPQTALPSCSLLCDTHQAHPSIRNMTSDPSQPHRDSAPNGTSTPASASTNTAPASAARPRARLGETQIVHLPASDSEPSESSDREYDDDGHSSEGPKTFPPDIEEIQLQHSRLKTPSLVSFNFAQYTSLKSLCLRQNELTSPISPEVFEGLGGLGELDLYDNRLGPTVEDKELRGCENVT